MAYLVDHPPARSQYRQGRRATPTGTIVLHTAENAPDLVPPDLGAENIARFIRDRPDAGSYHTINDQDSTIRLVPFEWEAFGDGTGSNPWAIHLSIAMQASQWWNLTDQQKLWYMAGLATSAREASDWLVATHGIEVPARRLTKASQTGAGFCTHMDRENWEGNPGRRSDPWGVSDEMWHLFLTLYADTADQKDDDMPLNADDKDWLRALATEIAGKAERVDDWDRNYGQTGTRRSTVRWLGEVTETVRDLKASEIASAVAAALSGIGSAGMSADDVYQAAKRATGDAMAEAFDR